VALFDGTLNSTITTAHIIAIVVPVVRLIQRRRL